jgi:hypothetical protein
MGKAARGATRGALLVMAALLAGAMAAVAQVDLPGELVGRWEGEQEYLTDRSEDPKRILVIESVSQVDGKWVATGRYGTARGLGRVNIEVDTGGRHPSLAWTTASGAQYQLHLMQEKSLVGKVTLTVGQGKLGSAGSRDRGLKLEKVK